MKRLVIFGNSGSGKSTLAQSYAKAFKLKHLDLDTIAWSSPGIRKEIEVSLTELSAFISRNNGWVIEGCYGSLLSKAVGAANEIIFLNPGIESCLANCQSRPWEPHKYESKAEQDHNLKMLLNWVAEYHSRTGEFSLTAHREIFDSFSGIKQELTTNQAAQSLAKEQSKPQ
ncbi:hypothetical protein V2O64_08560 [Verrucomicrobiaceae bacterium 227]